IIYEENNHGQLIPARRFSPEYWRDKYESHRLIQDVRQVSVRRQPPALLDSPVQSYKEPVRWHDEWVQFRTLMRRAFKSKMRNRANLFTTIVEAPLLAALIGGVMRYSESGHYDFASAYYIPQYLFFGLVVAMFLGLTNSADDIIRDRAVLQRERNLNVRLPYYIFSKFFALSVFAAIQCMLFVLIGNAILEVRGMAVLYFEFMFITSFTGVALGLLVSSLVADAKTAANIVPLVLIPNIILGGALIKYDEMNRNLDLVYTFQRWFASHPENGNAEKEETTSKLTVPFICEFIPMRWSYEALVVAQAKNNPLDFRQDELQKQIDALVKNGQLTDAQSARLDDLKDTLAMLSGLESYDAASIDKRLSRVDKIIAGKTLDPDELDTKRNLISAESLYENQKIGDLVSKAEAEQLDHRRTDANGEFKPINVFFGPLKYFYIFGRRIECSVLAFNSLVLVIFSLCTLGFLHISLRRQLSVSS
ncbi:MAG TPA: ABC transporter permease, partial [Chthoniobacteraceae bacterium]|nr:ABC transporter permease [Chthoniobacteraceae bacterium]